jgi:zinc protease
MIQALAALLLLTAGVTDLESRVTQFRLKNGLDVLVYVDSSAPVVSVNAFYKVGSYYEPTGLTGISHMLEHLTFKHTDIYKPGDFDRIVDEAGGRNNGFTSTYYSGYYEDLARDRWELGMRLEAARMGRCVFPDSEFESEHEVVTEERRLGDNRPTSALWELFEATAFLANPQRNPTIGWMDDVRRFTVQAVRDWYRRHYNPANAVLVVAGDVRPDQVRAAAEKYFGRLKGTPAGLTDYYAAEPEQRGERRIVVRRRVSQPQLVIGYRSPGIRDSLFPTAEVAASILGSGRSSRIYQRLVKKDGLATSAYSWNSVQRDPGLLQFSVSPLAESLLPRVESAIADEIERLKRQPPTDRELQRVRNAITAARMFDKDDISDVAYTLAANHLLTGDWRDAERYYAAIDAVTPEQVQDFCRRYLKPDLRTVGTLLPGEEAR